ncbi:MAG: hypothetical protein IPH44_24615 [Myxococcales bacterium]|nr:hypothetical protein [Myxococcales bacterium]MBK7191585.1 hypothetical protein [Myxococcales bacterium]MBP6844860.1 hypothetical protein [Kofleriaceae bacterium]
MPRTLALAAVALAALTSTAAAKRMPPPPPGPVTITSTSRPLTDHLAAHEAALIACAKRERGAVLKATVLVRWDADGTTGALRVGGSTARFGRCATAALRGQIPGVSGRASARAKLVIDRKRLGGAPRPDDGTAALAGCQVDSDCTIYFRTSACVPTDPIAVATSQLDRARALFPPKHIECAMGGPQYERLRRQNEGRWTASCVAARCELREHAIDPRDPLDGLGKP